MPRITRASINLPRRFSFEGVTVNGMHEKTNDEDKINREKQNTIHGPATEPVGAPPRLVSAFPPLLVRSIFTRVFRPRRDWLPYRIASRRCISDLRFLGRGGRLRQTLLARFDRPSPPPSEHDHKLLTSCAVFLSERCGGRSAWGHSWNWKFR